MRAHPSQNRRNAWTLILLNLGITTSGFLLSAASLGATEIDSPHLIRIEGHYFDRSEVFRAIEISRLRAEAEARAEDRRNGVAIHKFPLDPNDPNAFISYSGVGGNPLDRLLAPIVTQNYVVVPKHSEDASERLRSGLLFRINYKSIGGIKGPLLHCDLSLLSPEEVARARLALSGAGIDLLQEVNGFPMVSVKPKNAGICRDLQSLFKSSDEKKMGIEIRVSDGEQILSIHGYDQTGGFLGAEQWLPGMILPSGRNIRFSGSHFEHAKYE